MQELRFGSFSNGFKTLVHRKRVLVRSTRTCPPLSRISYLTQFIFEVQDKGPPLLFGSWLCHPYGARGSFSTLAFFVEVYTTGMKQVQYCAIIMFQGSSGSQVPRFVKRLCWVCHPVWDLYDFIVLELIFNEFEEIKVPRVRNWLCCWTPCVYAYTRCNVLFRTDNSTTQDWNFRLGRGFCELLD